LGQINNPEEINLEFKEKVKKFDPKKVYKGQPNPTKL
jgi:phosphoribosyl-AMP cyclohydrolase